MIIMLSNPKKAIRMVAEQTLANYCKPNSYLIKETYPLPPYSTIIGMIHAVCGFKTYHPMQVSVQGSFSSTVSDLYQRYAFGNMKFDPTRHQLKVPSGDREVGVTKGVGYAEEVTEMELVIHLVPENEEDFDLIMDGLRHPKVFPALGRHDDLLNITSFEVVDVALSQKRCALKRYAYVPVAQLEEMASANVQNVHLRGTTYKIRKRYTINPKTKCRDWVETIRVKHVASNPNIRYKNALVDSCGDLLFLA